MDRERLASLYQRRYNMIRTLNEETDELLIMEVEEKDIASLPFPENKIADLAMKIRKALDEIRKNNERMEFHAKRRKDYYEEKILA